MALIIVLRRKLTLGLILTALAYGVFGAPTVTQAAAGAPDVSTNSFPEECRPMGRHCQCGW
jgi:hypothetical protein